MENRESHGAERGGLAVLVLMIDGSRIRGWVGTTKGEQKPNNGKSRGSSKWVERNIEVMDEVS